jgi:RND family efflux transporter MFP subunit
MNMHTQVEIERARPAGRFRGLPVWQRVSLVVVPLAVVAGAYGLSGRQAPALAAPPPPLVTVAQPLAREVNEWDDYIGRFEASQSVEVRPRVSGQVTAIHFQDGAIVQKGQLLFTIDSRPFTAALAEAHAGLASANSDLNIAQTNLSRAERLVAANAVSQSDVDQLRAKVQAAQAAVAGAEARVRARALDVEFTQVRAPISGRISDRRVDAGNLVAAGEGSGGTLLTMINALDPIYFTFNGSEGLFLKAKRAREAGAQSSEVEIRLQDEADYKWKGSLDFTDNGLDPKSGTIRGRAVLHNPGLFLTPGMFGNMRLSSGGTAKALLVPDTAIQTDQARKIVAVVGSDGKVVARPVELGALVDGLRIVRSGLAPGDRVVISGIQLAVPGTPVRTQPGRITPLASQAEEAPASVPVAGAATLVAR